jgi:hypothetical protein
MDTRLHLIIDEVEHEAILKAASERGMTAEEWVRLALREALYRTSGGDVERKLAAIHEASQFDFPTADISRMVAEIESDPRNLSG